MAKAETTGERLARMQKATEATQPRRRGRPPGRVAPEPAPDDDLPEAGFEPASRRRPTRQPARASTRETVETTRRGAVVVTGRNGEQLTRRRTQVGDQYHVPGNEIPDGWSYQWNPVTVLNEEQIAQQNTHFANGWRPVPATRHPGRWMRPQHTGDIVVEGLRLEERPEALTEEALAEGEAKARRQIRDQADILRLGQKMPSGFQIDKRRSAGRKGAGSGIRIDVDRSMELPPGDYQPADDSIE
jgi:hypothetical protein